MALPAERLEPAAPAVAPAPVTKEKPAADANLLATTQQIANVDLVSALRLIAERHGQPYQQTVVEMAKLSFGSSKVSVSEYIDFGLYEKGRTLEEKRTYVGLTAMRQIWDQANYLPNWHGLLENKLAAMALLGAWGFPVIPAKAVYSEAFAIPALPRLACREDLLSYLRTPANYPLFGKPMDSFRSLGSMSLQSYDATSDRARLTTGGEIAITQVADEILGAYAQGYIFQGRVVPHAGIREVCGERLATVRVVTILRNKVPEVTRTLWKIPSGENVADNFWRSGNMIAELDKATGKVRRVQRGIGLSAVNVEQHPDTGATLVGREVPLYQRLLETACAAHRMFPDIGIIGWDMAATDNGPLIVEPNITPDFVLPQVADRRGIMDDDFKAFLAERKAEKEARAALDRKNLRAETRARNKAILGANK